ncbi:hypothetical protein KAU19_07175 [Candidatus Parcubacteria bacterium]|nr:hypothetical protein [Candidatus Parcubacteria bacterium]
MYKILNKKNFFVFLLVIIAIIIGFINVLPHLLSKNALAREGKEYYPFSFVYYYDETNVTGPRIREVLDGHYIVSDVDLYEYKDYPPFWPPLSPLLHYPILKLTNNIINTVIISDFLFPIFIFLLLFLLSYVITKKKFLSLFFACFFALYHDASINFPPFTVEYLKEFIKILFPLNIGNHPVANFLTLRESFIPCLPIFLSAIIFCYLNYKHNKKIFVVLFGIFYALNAYTYPFHFIYLSAALCVLLVVLCLRRRWDVVKRFALSFAVSFAVLAPFFYWQIKLRLLPQYKEIFYGMGVEEGHAFRISYWKEYIWYLIFSYIIFLWGIIKKRKEISYFIISFILTGILVLNMQVVLGFNVQPNHWEPRAIFLGLSLGWLVIFWWAYEHFSKKISKNIIFIVATLIIISLTSHAILYQFYAAQRNDKLKTIPIYMQESFKWLNNNTEIDTVVVSPSLLTNVFIPLYTHNNIFIPRRANSFAPENEIIDRLILAYKLFGVKKERLDQTINFKDYKICQNHNDLECALYNADIGCGFSYLFLVKYARRDLDIYTRYAKRDLENRIPKKLYEEIMDKYYSFDTEKALSQYRMDYLYLGPREKTISSADFTKFEKVYDNKGVEIYKYISSEKQ